MVRWTCPVTLWCYGDLEIQWKKSYCHLEVTHSGFDLLAPVFQLSSVSTEPKLINSLEKRGKQINS